MLANRIIDRRDQEEGEEEDDDEEEEEVGASLAAPILCAVMRMSFTSVQTVPFFTAIRPSFRYLMFPVTNPSQSNATAPLRSRNE